MVCGESVCLRPSIRTRLKLTMMTWNALKSGWVLPTFSQIGYTADFGRLAMVIAHESSAVPLEITLNKGD